MSDLEEVGRVMVGYYLDPFIWIAAAPNPSATPIIIDGNAFTETVYEETLEAHATRLGVNFSRDGLILFEFHELFGTRIDYPRKQLKEHRFGILVRRMLNLHLLSLVHSITSSIPETERHPRGFGPFTVSPRDFWYRTESQDGHLVDSSRSDVLSIRQSIPRRVFGIAERMSNGVFVNKDFLVRFPHPLKLEVIKQSLKVLRSIVCHTRAELVMIVCELLAKSYQAFFIDDDDDWALIISWTAIETIIADMWNTLLKANKVRSDASGREYPFISKKRLETLEDNRAFSASVRIEVLSFLGVIDISLYESITRVRKSRNSWIHRLEHVTPEDAQLATKTVVSMLTAVYGVLL